MTTIISRLLHVEHRDADVRRRSRNMILIAVGLAACSLLLAVLWSFQRDYISMAGAVGILIGAIAILALSRRGKIATAALAQAILLLVIILAQVSITRSYTNGSFYLLVPLLVAANTLTPRQYGLVLGACLAAYAALSVFLFPQVASDLSERNAFQDTAILMAFTGLVGMISVMNARSAARETAEARAASEASAAQLEQANASLELRVAERTQALEATLGRERAQGVALQESLERQRALTEIVNSLSQPILPVRPDVIVAPLVGNIDAERTERLLGQILEQIERRRARAIILDVTGVAVIDTNLARVLLQIAAAARLLGAHTTLVGIRPEVAQTLVSLDADLREISTSATLYEGLLALPS